ncbi:FAD-dependent oxidoreductase [Candidatus Methylacidiphilum fumarolicum]|uniref:FAD-dependent oxidoreductase n=1 Tax=Candidatus Methylacidiphilum fumarolicum TaxID=591154 RepID=UPI002447E0FE|nr:FAD-dependent oxidoreductase [Candidatus Methylacidiphilum fumarolicum]
MERADCLVIGAGIAGASVGFHLAIKGLSVIILEKESSAGYHSTGRSAVFFRGSHGLPSVRLLTQASKQFFESPPAPFFLFHSLLPEMHYSLQERKKRNFWKGGLRTINLPIFLYGKSPLKKLFKWSQY